MIPWAGDKVKLNPECKFFKNLQPLVGYSSNVMSARVLKDCPNVVCVTLDLGMLNIHLPEGRHFDDPIGAPSLFVLISGPDKCEVKLNCKDPAPVPGDILVTDGGIKHLIQACDCGSSKGRNNWPYGDMVCGAHVKDSGGLIYNIQYGKGWLSSGTLIRSVTNELVINSTDLKTANTRPGVLDCASCGGKLKNPMPGFDNMKHCPKCEP